MLIPKKIKTKKFELSLDDIAETIALLKVAKFEDEILNEKAKAMTERLSNKL